MKRLLIDLESTGKEICEIAALKVVDGKEVASFSILVKPTKKVDPKAMSFHGISEEELAEKGVPLARALEEFVGWLEEEKIASYQVVTDVYDIEFLRSSFREAGIPFPYRRIPYKRAGKFVSVQSLVASFNIIYLDDLDLVGLGKKLGVEVPYTHRALDDCRFVSEVINALEIRAV